MAVNVDVVNMYSVKITYLSQGFPFYKLKSGPDKNNHNCTAFNNQISLITKHVMITFSFCLKWENIWEECGLTKKFIH